MSRRGRARGARWGAARAACWIGALSAWLSAGCGDDSAEPVAPLGFQIAEARLPQLGCFEPVESPGDCLRAADCGGTERCLLDTRMPLEDRAPAPLTCGQPIGTLPARSPCERSEACETGLCALTGVCLEPCRASTDCPQGQYCRPVEARLGDEALGPVMACARPLVLPNDVRFTVAPGGQALTRGASGLQIPAVPDPAIVYVQGECKRSIEVLSLRANDQSADLYDRTGGYGGKRSTPRNPVLHDGSSLVTLVFPNNPALTSASRGLTLTVRVSGSERADIVVASRPPGRRALDLNLFYVGGGETFEAGGFHPGESRIADVLTSLDQRYRDIGLTLGEVREYDVVGAVREELSVLPVPRREVDGRVIEGRPERLDELFRLSAGLDVPGINVFLVSDMGSYIGISGGIPGVLGVHGSSRSGVAVAVDMLGDLSDADLVLMHEIAHYMGLFHTSESSGFVLDPLSDTPECGGEYDHDGDRELSPWECEEHGADNLMFWSGSGSLLTTQQVQVLASSVVLR